ncbi:MAG: lysophospholipid acyltransferase family protein [Endozoicomonas sp. (ex Botrylloides leachii)]|nr:lysophospholipid acyltransferase family protein [Endozoicomonas sp. (ex Botrylloides leachii)]
MQWILGGWSIKGQRPEPDKYVVVVAHHTSNWDFFIALSAKFILELRTCFFGKHTLFIGPFGWIMRILGGIPIKRSGSKNRVDQIIKAIRESDQFILALTPEGTRSKVKKWKTGFYYIAHGAGVPIIPAALDFKNKEFVIGQPFFTTGNISEDMKALHRFFAPYQPKYPELSCQGELEEFINK